MNCEFCEEDRPPVMVGSGHGKAVGSSAPAARYMVVAYQRGAAVCEVASVGAGLNGVEATYFAHELREEFPGAIVAILPKNQA